MYLAANHTNPSSLDTAVFFASLDGKEDRKLIATPSNVLYAAGNLLYVRDNALIARPFNSRGEFKGLETVLVNDIAVDASVWRGIFSVSDSGSMVYQPGIDGGRTHLSWFDRSGKRLGEMSTPDSYQQLALSPDDKKLLVSVGAPLSSLWIYDVAHSVRTRFTLGNDNYMHAVWSPDGTQIAYTQGGGAANDAGDRIMIKPSSGAGEAKQASSTDNKNSNQIALCDWSPDGRYLLYRVGTSGEGDGFDLWTLPLFGDSKPAPYIVGPGDQLYAEFSPNGKWVAYSSSETGRSEIYVAPFPATGAKWQVTSTGAAYPRWRHDGKAIFYLVMGFSRIFEAQVESSGPTFELGESKVLFDAQNISPNIATSQYDVTSDGQRFIVITTGDEGSLPLTVVQNWTSQLKK